MSKFFTGEMVKDLDENKYKVRQITKLKGEYYYECEAINRTPLEEYMDVTYTFREKKLRKKSWKKKNTKIGE